MGCRRWVAIDAHHPVEVLHELGLKLWPSVMDDLPRNAMQPEHLVPVNLGHAVRRERGLGRDDMNLLGEAIHHHADGIVPRRLWQFSDEVDRDDLPRARRNRVRVQRCLDQCPSCLGHLASLTSLDIPVDIPLESRPPVAPCDELKGLVLAWGLAILVSWCARMMSPCKVMSLGT